MADHDDIAAALPTAPPPAPARREAAIAEALRRFDGLPPSPSTPSPERPTARWTSRHAGGWVAAALALVIGVPIAWTSFGDQFEGGGRSEIAAVDVPAAAPVDSVEHAPSTENLEEPVAPAPASDAAQPGGDRTAAGEVRAPARNELAEAASPPPALISPAAPDSAFAPSDRRVFADARAGGPAAQSVEDEGGEIVVTSAARKSSSSSVPVAVSGIAAEADAPRRQARARSAEPKANQRAEACTVDDPNRSLAACGNRLDPDARGAKGRADARIADGLAKAWQGDTTAAIAAFDRAIEIAPRSAQAYFNRALAYRRQGEFTRALADLDQAVRLAPDDPRLYRARSQVHRQVGNARRARADANRAVELESD